MMGYEKIEDFVRDILLALTLFGFMGSIYFAINNMTYPNSINVVLMLPFILFLAPYLIMSLFKIKRVESKIQIIPRFLRDVVDNVESGMDIISAIKATSENEYSVLNEDIKKLVNQLGWGISFEDAFLNFSKNIGSNDLYRDFLLIIEARKIGGHAEKILRELSIKLNTDNLRNSEIKSNLSSTTFTGYISFMIFILIIVLVYNNLFLGIGSSLGGDQKNADLAAQNADKMSFFLSLLILLSYELAILSGFLFGLMQENNIIAGAPHVVLLVVITFLGFFFFI